MNLYLTGGTVRDHKLGLPRNNDLDFAVEAESYDAMLDGLKARGYVEYTSRPAFVTTRGRLPLVTLHKAFGGLLMDRTSPWVDADFTLCRAETMYSDQRHPDTVTPTDLRSDLGRRDFTVNAMAVSESGVWFDAYGGRSDAYNRVLRTVGDSVARFTEDPLRMLRAVRFAVTCNLGWDWNLQRAMEREDLVGLLATLPHERVREELNKALARNWRRTMLLLMVDYPLLADTLDRHFPNLWLKATTEEK